MPRCGHCNQWIPTIKGLSLHTGSKHCKKRAIQHGIDIDSDSESHTQPHSTSDRGSPDEALDEAPIPEDSLDTVLKDAPMLPGANDHDTPGQPPFPTLEAGEKRKSVWIEEVPDENDDGIKELFVEDFPEEMKAGVTYGK
jgi:hypothetical protein